MIYYQKVNAPFYLQHKFTTSLESQTFENVCLALVLAFVCVGTH
jgi:hypothetical protein